MAFGNTSIAPVRILILGTGSMANEHAKAYKAHPNAQIFAAVDLDADKCANFCDKHDIPHQFTDLAEAIDWDGFDAASNVTPDAAHFATTKSLIAAGKDILCEKPLATSQVEAQELASLAKTSGIINMINLSYRNVPAVQGAAQLVATGALGNCRHFEASYLQSWLTQPAWGDWRTSPVWLWRLSTAHGSKGVLGDVGIHILDFVSYIAGSQAADVSCQLKTFAKAQDDRIGDYVLDANDSCAMTLTLENGAMGVVSASRFASGHHNDLKLRIYGDRGGLEVSFQQGQGVLKTCLGADLQTETWTEVACETGYDLFDHFVTSVQMKVPCFPDFETGARLQSVLDAAERSSLDNSKKVVI